MAENSNALIEQRQKIKTIRELLDKQKGEIAKALPRHLTPDAMLRTVYTTLQSNPKLMECTPESLLRAVMLSSQMGLLPDGISGQSYFIPYKNKDNGWALEVQFQLGYKGNLELARRSGQVARVDVQTVYEHDQFEYAFGLNPKLDFTPSEEADRGKKKFVYALVVLKDGSPYYDVWSVNRINAHRNQYSQQPNGKAWTGSWDSMAGKTVLNHVLKFCPMSIEYQRAVALDAMADMGMPQNLDMELLVPNTVPLIAETVESEPKGKLDKIVEQDQAKRQSDAEVRPALDAEEQRVKNADKGKPTQPINDSVTQKLSACSDGLYSQMVDKVTEAREAIGKTKADEIVKKETKGKALDQLNDEEATGLIATLKKRIMKGE